MSTRVSGSWLVALAVCALSCSPASKKIAVTTYHYDNLRTGWNPNETLLKPGNVIPPARPELARGFQLRARVQLDDRVSAQPLLVPDVRIGPGRPDVKAQPLLLPGVAIGGVQHDVVYVVTQKNTIYAIDANTGAILLTRSLGSQVVPLGCGAPRGILSTPVIDRPRNLMYLVAYTAIPVLLSGTNRAAHHAPTVRFASVPSYSIHAVDLSTLSDRAVQTVQASNQLVDGTTVTFNASVQQQRTALLLANDNVYAAFGSFCDGEMHSDDHFESRGWILGWHAGTLQPLQANVLTDREKTVSTRPCCCATPPCDKCPWHLASIWMAGAADDAGYLYFATGNSFDPYTEATDPNTTPTNLSESVIKVSPDLTRVVDYFTPKPFVDGDPSCPPNDLDIASGGVLLLPDLGGNVPHIAVAGGKPGPMYLINRDSMGHFISPLVALPEPCLPDKGCGITGGESSFLNNIVSSRGTQIEVWQISTTPLKATKVHVSPTSFIGSLDDPGFYTAISSNRDADVIIWAVSRAAPGVAGSPVTLYAFQPVAGTELRLLFQSVAGTWDGLDNSKAVPMVANGHVYVASNQELDIFGLLSLASKP